MLYVDDLAIYCSGGYIDSVERRIQTTINNLTEWSRTTGFTFSPSKTVCMHICRKRGCNRLCCNLQLYGNPIKCVPRFRFLGLEIDNGLTWTPHIKALKASCNKTLDLLKHLSHKSWGADRTSLLRLYIMLIKPKLDYGCEAYFTACRTSLDSLIPIQNAAIRIATEAFRSSPIASITSESGLKPLVQYRNCKVLNYYARLHINNNIPMHDQFIQDSDDEEEEENEEEIYGGRCFLLRARAIMKAYGLNFANLMPEGQSLYPPWQLCNSINVCSDIMRHKKKDFTPEHLKQEVLTHLSTHSGAACIFTDGSKTENGVGCSYTDNIITSAKRLPTQVTIYTAELWAIYDAIQYSNNLTNNNITIVTDSRSTIEAISQYAPSHPLVQKIQCAMNDINK